MKTGDTIYSDKGCRRAKQHNYFGPCLRCPFGRCLEDGTKITALKVVEKVLAEAR